MVGAAPRPIALPDTSDMFPDIPKGIFELCSVEPCTVPSELSSIEGTKKQKKIQLIAFHLIFSVLPVVKITDTKHWAKTSQQSTHYSALLAKYKC